MAGRNNTQAGWGWRHQQERARIKPLVDAGVTHCARCGSRITPGQKWHLDHADIPGAHQHGIYLGPSHAACNVAAATSRPTRQPPAPALAFFDTSPKSLPPNPSDHPEVPAPQQVSPNEPGSPAGRPLQWPIPLRGLPSPLDTF